MKEEIAGPTLRNTPWVSSRPKDRPLSVLSLGTRGRICLLPTPHHYLGSRSPLPACLGSRGGTAKGMFSSQHLLKLTFTFSPSRRSESVFSELGSLGVLSKPLSRPSSSTVPLSFSTLYC